MDRRAVLAAGLALAAAGPALAIDPGTASGHYRDDDFDVAFSHAVALELEALE